jgi:hypothetical protein
MAIVNVDFLFSLRERIACILGSQMPQIDADPFLTGFYSFASSVPEAG